MKLNRQGTINLNRTYSIRKFLWKNPEREGTMGGTRMEVIRFLSDLPNALSASV